MRGKEDLGGRRDPLSEGESNAAKPLSADFASQNRRFSLQTSLILPELPPTAPALAWKKFVSLCMVRVLFGEVFVVWRGADALYGAASRPIGKRDVIRCDALCGISKHQRRKAILQVIFLWQMEIYPPSSVANATNCLQFSSPKGKPSLRRTCIANITLNSEYIMNRYVANSTSCFRPVALLCSAKEGLQKGFPLGGSCRVSD